MAAIEIPQESLADKKVRLTGITRKIRDIKTELRIWEAAKSRVETEVQDIEERAAVTLF